MTAKSGASAGSAGDRPAQFKSGDSTSRRVLEDVIKQTAALYSLEQTSDPADLEPLVEVARRFPDAEFELDPVLIELVTAALRRQMTQLGKSHEQLKVVANRVAQALYENPETQTRLSALWLRLLAVK
jgi:hypothetical protein